MDEITSQLQSLSVTDMASTAPFMPLAPLASVAAPLKSITALDQLKDVLSDRRAQTALIHLYAMSQSECTRNGACGMEIGMAREKDQGAVLKRFLGDAITLDIDNSLTEDFVIGDAKISTKHSSGKVGTAIKAKWTSADTSVQEAIRAMIDAEDEYYCHLLLTYIDIKLKKITMICCSAETNKNTIKTLKEEAFKVPSGNSRGIEYSRKAMTMLLANRYFTVEINDADISSGMNPIERRLQVLYGLGL
jgi:hypothetical protein